MMVNNYLDTVHYFRSLEMPESIVQEYIQQVEAGAEMPAAFKAAYDSWEKAKAPMSELLQRTSDIVAGKISKVPWPFSMLSRVAPVLMPGTITCLAGQQGAGKSLFIIQCMFFWLKEGFTCSVLSLESARSEHLERLLSQIENSSNHANPDWIKDHQKEHEDAIKRNSEMIDDLGSRIHCEKIQDITYFDVLEYIKRRGQAKDRIVVIDPITAADGQGQPWQVDRQLVLAALNLAETHNMSIIFTTHPTKQFLDPDVGHIAGGAAWSRFGQGVLWLERTGEQEKPVRGCCGTYEAEINRIIHLLKVRSGPGQGMRIGCKFDVESLLLSEKGIILKKEK